MSLLELRNVRKRHRRGRHEHVALDGVSLSVAPGELVAIWGVPRSGRTTLLRIAAGLEQPDAGTVRFAGREVVAAHGGMLTDGIGFAQIGAEGSGGESILDHVAMPLLARRVASLTARREAERQLERVGAASCAELQMRDLDASELVRVAIAQALASGPRLMLLDDPTRHVDLLERESILALVRTIADEGVAVLMTTGVAIGVAGVDRALTMSDGTLRGSTEADPGVVALHEARSRRGTSAS